MESAALIALCRQGDDLAWEGLVRLYQSRVFGLALHYLRHAEEARDATQDVFVKVYRGLPALDPERPFLPWLLRLTRNSCIDHMRRSKVRSPSVAVPTDDVPQLAATGPSPEEVALGDARRRLVYRALGALTAHSREMLLLRDIQELDLQEIGALLELPLGTVKSRVHRARLELARVVQRLDPSYGA